MDYPECDGSDSVKQSPPDQTKLFKIPILLQRPTRRHYFMKMPCACACVFRIVQGVHKGLSFGGRKELSECLIANQMNLENGYK